MNPMLHALGFRPMAMPILRPLVLSLANDGYLTIDAPWVVPALMRSVPPRGRVLEPAAGPFPDDGSPTRKRTSSQPSDALWADPQHQALNQEDDANDDPIPPAR